MQGKAHGYLEVVSDNKHSSFFFWYQALAALCNFFTIINNVIFFHQSSVLMFLQCFYGSLTIMWDFFCWSPTMVQRWDVDNVLLKSILCSCIFRLVFIFLESQNLAVSLDTPSGPITPIRASICIWQLWKFFIADLFVTEPCINPSQR